MKPLQTVSIGQAMRLVYPVEYNAFVQGKLAREPRIKVRSSAERGPYAVAILETTAPRFDLSLWVKNLRDEAKGRKPADACPVCGEPLDPVQEPRFSTTGNSIESLCHCCKCDTDHIVIYEPARVREK